MKNKFFIFLLLATLGITLYLQDVKVFKSKAESSNVKLSNTTITEIAAGTDHNLALDQEGNLWSWGKNDHGQLGDGTTNNTNVPIQIMRGHKFKKISAGNDCSAAIDVDGYLYGWGNQYNPTHSETLIPTLVSDSVLYRDVHCGYDYTQTVDNTNDRKYFGYAYYNCSGTKSLSGKDVHPVVLSAKTYRSFRANSYNDYAVYNFTMDSNIISADGNYFMSFSSYYSSYYGTTDYYALYVYDFIVDATGKVNTRFGKSSNENSHVFFPSLDLSNLDILFIKSVSVRKIMDSSDTGNSTAYFLDDNGDIYSVGYNGIDNYCGNPNYKTTELITSPIKINSTANFTKVSAGKSHVLALDENGKVHTWGNNAYGQLGLGDFEQKDSPTIISTLDETKSFNFVAFSNETLHGSFNQYGGSNYSIVQNGSKGTLTLNSDTGEFEYTSNSNTYGDDTLVISIIYGGLIVNYQVNVFIDRKPIFVGGTPSLNVECGQSINGNAPSIDQDGDSLIYSIYQQPIKGTVVLNNNSGSFTYTAQSDVAGGDSFILAVSDGYCTVQYPVSIHIHSLITFNDETSFNIDLHVGNSYSSNVNAIDIDGDSLTYSVLTNGSKGNVVIDSDGNYTYTALGSFYGEDTFTLRVDDGYMPLDITYTVHLFSVFDSGTVLFNKITKGAIFNSEIKTNANGAAPTYSIHSQASNGQVEIDESSGIYTYTPNVESVGDDSFEILVDYGFGQYILTIHIYQNSLPNDAGVAIDLITNENTNYNGSAHCVDSDGDAFTYSISTQPLKGSLSLNPTTGEFIYYPNSNVAGDDIFKINVSDGTDIITIPFNIHIESIIDLDAEVYESISQNASLTGNANAVDRDGDTLIYSINVGATNGVASIDSLTGVFTYVPFTDFYGSDSFVIKVDDGISAKTCTVHVTVNRRPIADKITINLITKGVAINGTAQCSDPDGDTLTYSIIEEPTKGVAIINSSNGAFAYTPNANAAGDDLFKVKATDGVDDVNISIIVHNETDVELEDQETTIVVNQGKSTNGQAYVVDLDGDQLTYSITVNPTQGTLNLNVNTGAWAYSASDTAEGTDKFSIKATDGNSAVEIEYNLLINTPATFEQNSYSFTTNQVANYTGQVSADDADGDTLTFSIVSQGTKGVTTIDSSSGKYVYVPNADEAGNDTFVVGVSDGNFVTEIEVNVHIESPIVVPSSTLSLSVNKNDVVTGNVTASDADGDALTFAIYQQGNKGEATIMGDGGFSYFASEGAGNDVFVISITDGTHTNYVSVNIHIGTDPYFEESSINVFVPESGTATGQVHGVDEDGDQLSYSVSTPPSNGTVTLNTTTGSFTYTVLNNSKSTTDSFIIEVSDGNKQNYVTVSIVLNNSPTVKEAVCTANQGGRAGGRIVATDKENDVLVYSISTQGQHGNASINSSTGEYTYLAKGNYYGPDIFVVTVSDGHNSVDVVVNVSITKNTKPSADTCHIELKSGSSVSGKINAVDKEKDTLVYSISVQGTKGVAYIDENTGEYTYSAFKDTSCYDCFIITVSDGYNSASYLVEVDITFVDSYNSWAIPTTIATGSVATLSIGALAFVLIKFKKKIFTK